jgi:hypothetical protein
MNIKAENDIQDQIQKLPKETAEAINAFDWQKATAEVGKKYVNDESSTGLLQVLVGMVLSGIDYGDTLAYDIEDEIGTTAEEAKNIAAELDRKVFKPVYDIMVQKIKAGLKDKNPDWRQNVDFVLSNGDYTIFQEEPKAAQAENGEGTGIGGIGNARPNVSMRKPASAINTDFITRKDGGAKNE